MVIDTTTSRSNSPSSTTAAANGSRSNSRPAVVFGYEGRSKQNGGNYDPKAFDDLLKRLKTTTTTATTNDKNNKRDTTTNNLTILEVVDTCTYMDYTYDFDDFNNFDTTATANTTTNTITSTGEGAAGAATTTAAGTTTTTNNTNNNSNTNSNKVIPNMIRDNEKAFSAALQANTSILTVTVDLKLPQQRQRQRQTQRRIAEAETETETETETTRGNSITEGDDEGGGGGDATESRTDSNTTTVSTATATNTDSNIEDEYYRISKFVAYSIGQLQCLRDLTVHVYDDLKGFDTIALLLNNVKTTTSLTVYCACNNNNTTTGTHNNVQRTRRDVTTATTDNNDNNETQLMVGSGDNNNDDDTDDPTAVVVRALREHRNLKSLTVHCDDPYLFRPFISAVPAMSALERINLSYDGGRRGTMLRIRDLCTVCFGSSTVKEITLTDFTFGSHHNYVLAEAMASLEGGLTSMKIYGYQTNHTVAENCELICENLATNTTLKKFHFLVPSDDDVRFCRALGGALIRNTSLTELTLDGEIKDEAFTEICSSVGHENSKLKRLKLEGCNVSSSQAAVDGVSTMLENNNSLVELEIEIADLSVCADTLVACISAIQQNAVMKRLDVVGRPVFIEYEKPVLTLDQAKIACKAIQKNFSLTHCSKFRIKRSKGGTKKDRASTRATIAALLKLNRCGRRYLLDESASKNRGLSVLALVSNDPDCVYTHLLENPSLCDTRKWIRTRRKRTATKNNKKSRGTKLIRTIKEST